MSNANILELPQDTGLPQPVLDELNMRLLWIGQQLTIAQRQAPSVALAVVAPVTGSGLTISGLRSERLGVAALAAQNYPGAQFYETNTALVYVSRPIALGGAGYVWSYMSGVMRGTFAGLLSGLGSLDAGLLFTITDKNRTLRWDGAAWTFADWEVIPVGYVSGFKADPGTGWHICDGTTVANGELHADGTLHNVTFPDFTSAGNKAAYPKWAAAASGFTAAVAAGFTGITAAGTAVIAPVISGVGFAQIGGTTDDDSDAGVIINNPASGGTPVTVALKPHKHPLSIANAPDAGHQHVVSAADSGHTHAKGTLAVDATAEPRRYELIPYQRV